MKKQYQNTFLNGLVMDQNELSGNNQSYVYAMNGSLLSDGDNLIFQNMTGNDLKALLPEGYVVKGISVFNGIAYIVSQKYTIIQGENGERDTLGDYEYTELGTYPSPDWENILAKRIKEIPSTTRSSVPLSASERKMVVSPTVDEFHYEYTVRFPVVNDSVKEYYEYRGNIFSVIRGKFYHRSGSYAELDNAAAGCGSWNVLRCRSAKLDSDSKSIDESLRLIVYDMYEVSDINGTPSGSLINDIKVDIYAFKITDSSVILDKKNISLVVSDIYKETCSGDEEDSHIGIRRVVKIDLSNNDILKISDTEYDDNNFTAINDIEVFFKFHSDSFFTPPTKIMLDVNNVVKDDNNDTSIVSGRLLPYNGDWENVEDDLDRAQVYPSPFPVYNQDEWYDIGWFSKEHTYDGGIDIRDDVNTDFNSYINNSDTRVYKNDLGMFLTKARRKINLHNDEKPDCSLGFSTSYLPTEFHIKSIAETNVYDNSEIILRRDLGWNYSTSDNAFVESPYTYMKKLADGDVIENVDKDDNRIFTSLNTYDDSITVEYYDSYAEDNGYIKDHKPWISAICRVKAYGDHCEVYRGVGYSKYIVNPTNTSEGDSDYWEDYVLTYALDANKCNDIEGLLSTIDGDGNRAYMTQKCSVSGSSVNLKNDYNFVDAECDNGDYSRNVYLQLKIKNNSSEKGTFKISNKYIATGGMEVSVAANSYDYFDVLLIGVYTSPIDIKITSSIYDESEYEITVNASYYVNVCDIPNKRNIKECYSPLYNYSDSSNDLILSEASNFDKPFRNDEFIKESFTDIEIETQVNYDNSVNIILNDRVSKVKMINSRFVYDPVTYSAYIPLNSGYKLANVYSEKYINTSELIPRFNKRAKVKLKSVKNGGKLLAGKYFYNFRYVDSDGNTTDVFNSINGVSAFEIKDDYSYGVKAYEETNSSHIIELSDFDKSFNAIEVSYCLIAGDDAKVVKFFRIDNNTTIPLSNSLDLTINGYEDITEISADEFMKGYNHHLSINSLTQDSSRLVFSGIKNSDVLIYDYIQKLFVEKCTIKESYLHIYSFDKSVYSNGFYESNRVGYWRGETYQLGVELGLKIGGKTTVFNPRGIDNYSGGAEYSNTPVSSFSANYGENPFGVYRTKASSKLMSDNYAVTVSLYIDGLDEIMRDSVVRSICDSYTVVRKERVKDAIIQGYSSSVFKVGTETGLLDSEDTSELDSDTMEKMYPYANSQLTSNPTPGALGLSPEGKGAYYPAHFGLTQVYFRGKVNVTEDDDGNAEDVEIKLKNYLVKQRDDVDKFAFMSADLYADPYLFANEFSERNHSYQPLLSPTYVHTESKTNVAFEIDDNVDTYTHIRAFSNIGGERNVSTSCSNMYINEDMRGVSNDLFAARCDTIDLNMKFASYIGVQEKNEDKTTLISSVLRNESSKYGAAYNTNVYRSLSGVLSNNEWVDVYKSQYNNGGYSQVTQWYDIDNTTFDDMPTMSDSDNIRNDVLEDRLNIFGGDCYINRVPIRIFYPIGIEGVVSPDIKDYYKLGSTNADADDIVNDVIGYDDDIHKIIKGTMKEWVLRARLVPKGIWVDFVHESNYNMALRVPQNAEPVERGLFGHDRGFLGMLSPKTEISSKQLEAKIINKGYTPALSPIHSFAQFDFAKLLREYHTRVEVSSKAVKGSLSNGYRDFFGINFADYDTSNGAITKIVSSNNKLFAFQERAVSVVPLDDKYAVSEENGGVYVSQNQVLYPELSVLSNTIGCITPNSVISIPTGVYFYDHNTLNIGKVSSEGLMLLSQFKIKKFLHFFKDKLDEIQSEQDTWFDVKTNYDELTGNVYFSFIIYKGLNNIKVESVKRETFVEDGTSEQTESEVISGGGTSQEVLDNAQARPNGIYDTQVFDCVIDMSVIEGITNNEVLAYYSIYFNDKLGKWISPLSWSPKNMFTLVNKTYSVNSLYNSNRIYEHNEDSNYNFFYEQQHGLALSFVVNQDSYVQKILDNLLVISNNVVPIAFSYDVDLDQELDSLKWRDIDSYQICKTRRHELKIVGLNDENNEIYDEGNNYTYVNINRPEKYIDNTITYEHNGVLYRIDSYDYNTTNRFGFPRIIMEYSIDNGSTWSLVDKGNYGYRNIFGLKFKTIKISLIKGNSDYVEDIMYVQVQRKKKESDIRDKHFVVTIRYDGIEKTVIQAVLSLTRVSHN